MNFNEFSYRRALVGLLWAAGLAHPTWLVAETPSSAGAPSAVTAQRAVAIGAGQITSTRVLFARAKEAVGVELKNGVGINQIVLKTRSARPQFSIDRLSNPNRLVIDIDGEVIKASQKSPIADLEYVSGIRIGSHPGKARAVLDLAEGVEVVHSAEAVAGAIVVTLSSPTAAIADADVDPAPELVADAAEDALPVADLPAADLPADTESEAVNVQPVSATTPERRPGVAEVKGVQFENVDGRAALRVNVEGEPEFSISKTAPSEYVLTIRNSSPADSATAETALAEKGSVMRSARATIEGNDTLIRVFADPSVYLTARRTATGVVVEQTSDLVKVVDDIRAQLKPEGADAKKEAASSPAPTAPTKDAAPVKDAAPAADTLAAKPEKKAGASEASDDDVAPMELGESQMAALLGNETRYTGRLISLDLQETDIDNALRIIAEVSNLNIVASEEVTGKVTLRLLDVPWDQALDVILKSNGLDKVLEGNVMRIAPFDKLRQEREALKQARVAEEELEPLSVKYVRVSYAKASEIKDLVETVLTERGSAAYDERSNQLIIKDVKVGLKNVAELIKKIDLRTPQVLLETQIVEAERNLQRELGSELGFQYIQSPATGNGTGLNFPAAVSIGGSAVAGAANIIGSAFPANTSATSGSGISLLFDSADGTKTLEARLSQLEQEGRARIISRPAVSTTNNKAAEIKSVKKIRVVLPNGGLSVATGAGAQANGGGQVATETIEAGIVLNVTPQASPDYYILLDIRAKSSSFVRDNLTDLPTENERSASSTVLVSSGQTFALGGIYKITEGDTISGVPFFKDIPFLGTFFRRTNSENRDEELLFFITPRIVEGSFDDASMRAAQ